MGFTNIIVGTAILWLLNGLIVVPLAGYWTRRTLGLPVNVSTNDENLTEEDKARINSTFTRNYILADVLILGTAGFIGGLLGYYFIGISFEAKGWPGMIAFIVSSFTGLIVRRG